MILSHPIAAMLLVFFSAYYTVSSLPERFVYVPQRLMFPVMACPHDSFICLQLLQLIVNSEKGNVRIKTKTCCTGRRGCSGCLH
jgi:hypothetical protein